MSKPFETALQEWKEDNKYAIGDDIGDEFYDLMECPTHSESSLAHENVQQNTVETVLDSGPPS